VCAVCAACAACAASHKSLRREGYVCPQCGAKCCELPMECPVCGLTLVSSSHLARSYHHLFPLPLFQAVPLAPTYDTTRHTHTTRHDTHGA
jgi:transcription initiation factor TFIIH subunit 2